MMGGEKVKVFWAKIFIFDFSCNFSKKVSVLSKNFLLKSESFCQKFLSRRKVRFQRLKKSKNFTKNLSVFV